MDLDGFDSIEEYLDCPYSDTDIANNSVAHGRDLDGAPPKMEPHVYLGQVSVTQLSARYTLGTHKLI